MIYELILISADGQIQHRFYSQLIRAIKRALNELKNGSSSSAKFKKRNELIATIDKTALNTLRTH